MLLLTAKNNTKQYVILALIMLLGAFLRYWLCKDDFLHPWDERYHALVAKNLIANPFKPLLYKIHFFDINNLDWRHSSVWLHKQPFTLWVISASLYLFGTDEFFVRLPSLILSVASIYLVYKISERLFNQQVGLLASFFFSINGFIIEITSGRIATDHVDIFFMFFILLGVYVVVYNYQIYSIKSSIIIGFIIGVAVLCKWLPAYIILLLFIVLNLKSISFKILILHACVIVFVSVLVFIPWQIFIFHNYFNYANAESLNNWHHFTEVLDGQSGNIFYYLDKIRMNYHDLIYIPIVYIIYKCVKEFNIKYVFLLVWIFVPIVIFSLASTKMQGYILFVSPALFIVLSFFIIDLKSLIIKKVYYYLMVAVFLLVPLISTIDRVFVKNYDQDAENIYKLKTALKKIPDDFFILLNCNNYIEAMYYSNCSAYPFIPSQTELDKFKINKISIYQFNKGDYNSLLKVN